MANYTRTTHHADRARRIARQHAETSQLMGVDFLPSTQRPMPSRSEGGQPLPTTTGGGACEDVSVREVKVVGGGDSGGASSREDKARALETLRRRHEAESPLVRDMPGYTNIVFGDGNPSASLMFVGEAPGADEDAQGIPFVGRAGKKLNEMIEAMGLSRSEVYIANVLKVRPPQNRTPTPEEASQDGPFLLEQIRIIRPDVVVTLGKPAARFLLGIDDAMGRMRGKWFDVEGIPVMPTYHPAYLLRAYTPENRRKVWSDLQLALTKVQLLGG